MWVHHFYTLTHTHRSHLNNHRSVKFSIVVSQKGYDLGRNWLMQSNASLKPKYRNKYIAYQHVRFNSANSYIGVYAHNSIRFTTSTWSESLYLSCHLSQIGTIYDRPSLFCNWYHLFVCKVNSRSPGSVCAQWLLVQHNMKINKTIQQ